jgi:hypothetical protein
MLLDFKMIIGIIVVVLLAVLIFAAMRKKAPSSAKDSVSVDPMAPYGVTSDDGIGPKPEDAIVAFISNAFLAATDEQLKLEKGDIILKSYDFGETDEFTCEFQVRGIKAADAISSFVIYGTPDLKIATLIKIRDEVTYRALENLITPRARALFSQEFTE